MSSLIDMDLTTLRVPLGLPAPSPSLGPAGIIFLYFSAVLALQLVSPPHPHQGTRDVSICRSAPPACIISSAAANVFAMNAWPPLLGDPLIIVLTCVACVCLLCRPGAGSDFDVSARHVNDNPCRLAHRLPDTHRMQAPIPPSTQRYSCTPNRSGQ